MGEGIIITGFSGMIGEAFVQGLEQAGRTLYLINTKGIFKKEPRTQDKTTLSSRPYDYEILKKIFSDSREYVHLASAYAPDGKGGEVIASQLNTNILLMDFFVQFCRDFNLKFFFPSTAAVYYLFAPDVSVVDENTPLSVPKEIIFEARKGLEKFREFVGKEGDVSELFLNEESERKIFSTTLVQSLSPRQSYIFSKYMAEQVLVENLPADRRLVLRLSNIFGSNAPPSSIIPKFVKEISEGRDLQVFDWSRNFLHIDDLVKILKDILTRKKNLTGIINIFNPANTVSLYNLAFLIKGFYPQSPSRIFVNPDIKEPHLEFRTIHRNLFDFPMISLREGIKRMVSRESIN